MHERYGGLLRLVFESLFGPIHYPVEAADRIRQLAAKGTVVYVSRARSTWLVLYFNHALSRLGLPLARFVGGINLLLWQPVDRLWRLWRERSRTVASAWRKRYGDRAPTRSESLLADIVLRGEAAFLALEAARVESSATPNPKANDYLRALVASQRLTDRPIYLVPHAVTDRILGGATKGSWTDRLLGRRARPGQRRRLPLPIVTNFARVRVGDAVDLKAMITEHPTEDDQLLARRVRHELTRRIADEERVIAGPELPTFDVVAKRVLRESIVKDEIAAELQRSGKPAHSIEARATRYLKEIAANYSPRPTSFFSHIMSWIFNRLYDGITVDEPGLETTLAAIRKAPVVFCPSHKSHVDYLVLSYVLWNQGVAPPHIAAGANLSFFPLGALFRRAGAFFLRRSFKGNPLYAAVFRAYVIELVRQGTSMEFFIEGTRTRTGKVLMPKLGLLSMVVDAYRRGVQDDVLFIPASVDYERIIEANAYERELKGADKKPEDLTGLLKTTSVLTSRYGGVYVQLGQPLSLKAIAETKGLPRDPAPEHDEAWRKETARLGYKILHDVAHITSVTPTAVTATALLGHKGRGMPHQAFIKRVTELVDFLDSAAARLTDSLANSETRGPAVLEAINRLVNEGAVTVDRPGGGDSEPIYRVVEDRRISLDFYKNSVINYMAAAAIACRALVRRGGVQANSPELADDCRFLSWLLKREFLWRADAQFDTYFDDTLATLAVRGWIDVYDDGRVVVREREAVQLLSGVLDSFIEAYWATASTLGDLRQFPLWEKELVARATERARRSYLEGHLRRPESAARVLIQNAVAWMQEAGAIEENSHGKKHTLKLSQTYEVGKLETLLHDLGAFLS